MATADRRQTAPTLPARAETAASDHPLRHAAARQAIVVARRELSRLAATRTPAAASRLGA